MIYIVIGDVVEHQRRRKRERDGVELVGTLVGSKRTQQQRRDCGNQEENDRLWIGSRDEDNKYIIRNPNSLSPMAKAYTSLAKGHPEGWNDAFKGNIWSFYQYIADGMQGKPLFASLFLQNVVK